MNLPLQQVSGVAPGTPVPVQISAAGQAQPHLASGLTTIRPAGNLSGQGNIQAVSMAGKNFPYMRLVNVSTSATTSATQGTCRNTLVGEGDKKGIQ